MITFSDPNDSNNRLFSAWRYRKTLSLDFANLKKHAAPRAPHAPKIWDLLMTDSHIPAAMAFDGTCLEVMCQGC